MGFKENLEKGTTNLLKKAVNHSLKVDANNTTCLFVYQPKVPSTLKKFSKVNK